MDVLGDRQEVVRVAMQWGRDSRASASLEAEKALDALLDGRAGDFEEAMQDAIVDAVVALRCSRVPGTVRGCGHEREANEALSLVHEGFEGEYRCAELARATRDLETVRIASMLVSTGKELSPVDVQRVRRLPEPIREVLAWMSRVDVEDCVSSQPCGCWPEALVARVRRVHGDFYLCGGCRVAWRALGRSDESDRLAVTLDGQLASLGL